MTFITIEQPCYHIGINGTVSGPTETIQDFVASLRQIIPIEEHELKFSTSENNPFYRMRTMIKPEIITMGCEDVDPEAKNGTYVDSKQWNHLLEDPNVLLIGMFHNDLYYDMSFHLYILIKTYLLVYIYFYSDTRNTYEVDIGTFKGAVNPNCLSFRDFPSYVQTNLNPSLHKKVAMYCTGGVRCEKASNYMLQNGFEEVYHLKGGILKYLEEIPVEDSKWQGECYVFDQRVAVGHGLVKGSYTLCRTCRHTLKVPDDLQHEKYEESVSCSYCYDSLDDGKRESSRQRHRQILLAESRNEKHLGYQEEKHLKKNTVTDSISKPSSSPSSST
jgi:UPF0176 protein